MLREKCFFEAQLFSSPLALIFKAISANEPHGWNGPCHSITLCQSQVLWFHENSSGLPLRRGLESLLL